MADFSVTLAALAAISLATPLPSLDAREVHCLAEVAFYEARGESERGQRMVMDVVLNRVAHPDYPKTVCGVIRQRGQFTYRRSPRAMAERGGRAAWERSVRMAAFRLSGRLPPLTQEATHFYNPRLARPEWARRGQLVAQVGDHAFVRVR
jgi:N-acetylmuramoyl-L-alanine amidase